MTKFCRNCRFYNVDAVKNASGAVLRGRVARCMWVSIEVYPSSVTRSGGNYRPTAGYMEPYDGSDCPTFEQA